MRAVARALSIFTGFFTIMPFWEIVSHWKFTFMTAWAELREGFGEWTPGKKVTCYQKSMYGSSFHWIVWIKFVFVCLAVFARIPGEFAVPMILRGECTSRDHWFVFAVLHSSSRISAESQFFRFLRGIRGKPSTAHLLASFHSSIRRSRGFFKCMTHEQL